MQAYEYALSITSQFYFCGIPFRLDPTPKCGLDCRYCFAMARGGRRTATDQIVDVAFISRKVRRAMSMQDERLDVNGELLRHRVPVHFGGISDPFSSRKASLATRELLQLLNQYQYPIVLSTKNTVGLLNEDILDLLKGNPNIIIQVSVTTLDSELAIALEPNAPAPAERLRSIKGLADEGLFVTARLQPLFPFVIDEAVAELIPALGDAGCKHVTVEFLKLPVEKKSSLVKEMLDAISWDGHEFYRLRGAELVGREWVLPNQLKWDLLQPVVASIRDQGMTYGAGDYGLNHLGDTDCCCGLNKKRGFENWFRANFANVIRRKEGDYVAFGDVARHWMPERSIARFMNSKCRLTQGNTILHYLKNKWNRPGTANAPDTFLGVSWEGDRDGDGNCVYSKKEVRAWA